MTFLQLVGPSPDQDTVSILRGMLAKARRGEVVGVTICYRTRAGVEDTVYSGLYWDRPAEAVRAALRVSMQLTLMDLEQGIGP